jgi:hypothetical protein
MGNGAPAGAGGKAIDNSINENERKRANDIDKALQADLSEVNYHNHCQPLHSAQWITSLFHVIVH